MKQATGRVLVVDDDESMRDMLEQALGGLGHTVCTCATLSEALDRIASDDPEVLLTDLRLRGESGLDVCQRAMERSPELPVVVMTGFGSMESAIAAIRAGAYDFVTKPVELTTLGLILQRAIRQRRLLDEIKRLRADGERRRAVDTKMIGESRAIRKVVSMIERLRETDATVLISGESGTGKELVARALHESSVHRDGPFIAVNCAAVPAELLESELFGHVRGAFTDARRARDGLFVRANRGTLLLDEIGEMPLEMQPKLLRALQERKVRPVGGNREVEFDVRLLAATNRDLESMVEEREFREDLFYRVNVVQLQVPPPACPRNRHSPARATLCRHVPRARRKKRSKPVCRRRDQTDDQWRNDQGRHEPDDGVTAKHRRHSPGKNRAEHIEFAMRNVDDAHDPEHDAKTHRGKRQNCSRDSAFKRGKQKMWTKIH